MSSIRPQLLSDEELLRYSWVNGVEKLSAEWVTELVARMEKLIDENTSLKKVSD